MNDALLYEVDRRLRDQVVAAAVADLIMTACLSPDESGPDGPGPDPDDPGPGPLGPSRPDRVASGDGAAAADRARVYLDSVRVEGFRGIGPPLTLALSPGPGLCLIVGANGTGKSSLSDALEVLLTGNSARWAAKKSKTWQDGWRNLHHRHPTVVEARLVVEGRPGYTTVTRTWPAGADLAAGAVSVTRPGQPTAGFDSLGWQDALASYRPFLSYSELGGLLEDGPSKLFDALNAILGLEDLTVAAKGLAATRLGIERRAKQTTADLTRVRTRLAASTDERAIPLLAALAAKSPDLDAVGRLVEPTLITPPQGGQLDLLRRLALLDLPTADEVADAAGRLASAAARVEEVAASDAGRARAVADLLDAAVEFHRHHGDGACPVCGQPGGLSPRWRADADVERARLRHLAAEADDAHRILAQALAHASGVLQPRPDALADAGLVGIDATVAFKAWAAWSRPVDTTAAGLADHLTTIHEWRDDVGMVRAEAEDQLAGLEDQWRPVAQATMAWLDQARSDKADAATVKDLKAAEAWLKKAEEAIRAERFAPLATAATEVWQMLRQRSSVDIGAITMTGAATSHQVIVLTHDERLPEAVRRLRVAATMIEVYRGPGSEVLVTKGLDPVDRHLRDARQVASDTDLPTVVTARVVPTLCRQALEAACVDIVRRRRLSRGDRHEDVEKAIAAANMLTKSLALACFDDVDKGGEVSARLLRWGQPMVDVYRACNRGAHVGYSGNAQDLVTDTRALVKRLGSLP